MFRLRDGYDPSTPLKDTDTVVKTAPVRRVVTPLAAESFQGGTLVGKTEVTYGYDIYDRYDVKVPAEKTTFSFDVPIPPQGAANVRAVSSNDDGEPLPVTSETVGGVIRVTVDYSAEDSFRDVQDAPFSMAGFVDIRLNYPEKTEWGEYADDYRTVYSVRYFRESAAGTLDNQYRMNVTMQNREFAEIAKNYHGFGTGWDDRNGYQIMFNQSYTYDVYDYFKTGVSLAKIEKFVVNGLDIPVPPVNYADAKTDAYEIPGMGGGTVTLGTLQNHDNSGLQLLFENLFPTRDLDIQVVFEKLEPKYKLTAAAADATMGSIAKAEFDRRNADGDDVYVLRVKLEKGYAVQELAVNGSPLDLEPVRMERDNADNAFYVVYEVPVARDTELLVRFKPADFQMSLAGYSPVSGLFEGSAELTELSDRDLDLETKPLVPYLMSAGVWLDIKTEGWLLAQEDKNGKNTADDNTLRLYSGGQSAVGNQNALVQSYKIQMDGRQTIVSVKLHFNIMEVKDNMTYTAVLNRDGVERSLTFQVGTVLDNPQNQMLYSYYMSNFGTDKFGMYAFSEAEKQTNGYKKYVQYASTRLYLRKTLENALQDIAAAEPGERPAKLELAKSELRLASKGAGGYAVMTSCAGYTIVIVPPREELGYRGDPGLENRGLGSSGATAMCAALEAQFPANWHFDVNNGGIVGGFGQGGTGKIQAGPGMAGFWYINGVFANVGVFGHPVRDGDLCTWGGGSIQQVGETASHYAQTKVWDLAVLYTVYTAEELEKLCGERGLNSGSGWQAALQNCDAEMLQRLFPEVDFTRFGRTGRELSAGEKVKELIFSLGPVGPDSLPQIQAARAAYEALDDAGKAELKQNQYPPLQEAEKQYAMITAPETSDALSQARKLLNKYTGKTGIRETNLDSVPGMLAQIVKAHADDVPDNEDETRALISYLNNRLTKYPDEIERNFQSIGSAYYATLVISLGAGAYNASNFVDSDGNLHDFTAYLKDYDAVTAEGAAAVALSLIALDSKPYDVTNSALRERYVQWLAANQREDGVWLGDGVWNGTGRRGENLPDPDATTLVLTALSNYTDWNSIILVESENS